MDFTVDSIFENKKVYLKDDSIKQAMTIDLFLEYPISLPDSLDYIKIQSLIAHIFLGDDTSNIATKLLPKQAFTLLEEQYINEASNYGKEWELDEEPLSDFSEYYKNIATRIDTIIGSLMVVSTAHSAYLGGAHGGYYILYDNIDLQTAQIINEKELFKVGYQNALASIIQQIILSRNNSENEEDHINLLFDLEDIKPNENFFFSKKGLVYVYNEYDITSYADGMTEIVVPYASVINLVKEKYSSLINDIQ